MRRGRLRRIAAVGALSGALSFAAIGLGAGAANADDDDLAGDGGGLGGMSELAGGLGEVLPLLGSFADMGGGGGLEDLAGLADVGNLAGLADMASLAGGDGGGLGNILGMLG